MYQPVPPYNDPVPPSTNQYRTWRAPGQLGDYRLLHSLPRVLFTLLSLLTRLWELYALRVDECDGAGHIFSTTRAPRCLIIVFFVMHIVTSTWEMNAHQYRIEWCSFIGTKIWRKSIHNPFIRWWGSPFSSSEILNAQLRCDNRPHQTRPNTMVKVWRKNQKWGSILRTFLGQFGRFLKIPDWNLQNVPFTQLRSPSCGASVLVHPRSGPGQRGSGYQQKKSTDIFLYKDGIVVCIFAMNNTKGEYQAVDYWLAGRWDGHGHEDADDGGARSSRGGLPHSTTSKASSCLNCWWLLKPVKLWGAWPVGVLLRRQNPWRWEKITVCTIISFTMLPRLLRWSIRAKSLPGWALDLYTIQLEGEAWL